MDNDNFMNISSVIDLLEDKSISWGHYQEDMLHTGFEGFAWINQRTHQKDYVRTHASDGHDTSVTTAGTWTKTFVEPLLTNQNFMKNTLVLITFDENHTYTTQNRVLAILLRDAVPSDLVGTTDSNFHDHYSEIATVEANWNLHTLGRWDVGANVFSLVGSQTGDKIREWEESALNTVFPNSSYPGLFNSKNTDVPLPVPNAKLQNNGRTVLPAIEATWTDWKSSYYADQVEIPDGQHPPVYPKSVLAVPYSHSRRA
ncbi:MAG: hypothetical protein Q9191_003905 [Dirinaria sp. TL-2023a]